MCIYIDTEYWPGHFFNRQVGRLIGLRVVIVVFECHDAGVLAMLPTLSLILSLVEALFAVDLSCKSFW